MLEESLAEVGQMEVDADWQAEVNKRLEKAEERQEKQRERLVNLSKQTCAKEDKIAQLMLEVEGKQVRISMLRCKRYFVNSIVIYEAQVTFKLNCFLLVIRVINPHMKVTIVWIPIEMTGFSL